VTTVAFLVLHKRHIILNDRGWRVQSSFEVGSRHPRDASDRLAHPNGVHRRPGAVNHRDRCERVFCTRGRHERDATGHEVHADRHNLEASQATTGLVEMTYGHPLDPINVLADQIGLDLDLKHVLLGDEYEFLNESWVDTSCDDALAVVRMDDAIDVLAHGGKQLVVAVIDPTVGAVEEDARREALVLGDEASTDAVVIGVQGKELDLLVPDVPVN